MGTRRGAVLAVTLVLVGLAGCADEPPDPPPSTSTGTSSATEPTTTAPTVALPDLPAAATEQTDQGAMAFVRHWYDLVNYAFRSGDGNPLALVSDTECTTCAQYIELTRSNAADGSVLDGDRMIVETVNAPAPQDGQVIVNVTFSQAAVNEVASDGRPTPVAPAPSTLTNVLLKWTDGSWLVLENAAN